MEKLFEAIVPGWKGRGLPSEFPLHVRVALRLSVLVVHWFAFKRHGRTFSGISFEKRVHIIESLYNHPNATIRGLVQWWKLTALMTQC